MSGQALLFFSVFQINKLHLTKRTLAHKMFGASKSQPTGLELPVPLPSPHDLIAGVSVKWPRLNLHTHTHTEEQKFHSKPL